MKRKSTMKTGVDPNTLKRMLESGELKQYGSLEEMRAARKARGVRDDDTPVHLLPEDHYRKRKRYTITLSPDAHALAKKVANGNVSRGIEYALLHWQDCPRTDRRRRK